MMTVVVASACGGNVIVDGAGGSTTSVSATVSSSTTNSTVSASAGTTTGTGGDPCSTGADCAQCPDHSSCAMCNEQVHAAGAPAFNALANCILCVNCYTACEPGAQGTCPAPPAMKGPCDTGTFGQAECQVCQQCSFNGACHSAMAACQSIPDCVALATDLGMCPTQ